MIHVKRVGALAAASAAMVVALAQLTSIPATARADAVAYLVNVTVRPGYHFASPQDALSYGHSVCDKVSRGARYADVVRDIKSDFETDDEFQASYLISQAVNELCPAQIWQLRNSAAFGPSSSP